MPIRNDQRMDAGDLDGLPIGQDPAEGVPDTRPRTRPIRTVRAEGSRYRLEEMDDGRWSITVVKAAGPIQVIGTPAVVRACVAVDAHPEDVEVIDAALPARVAPVRGEIR